jgi:voltage-gated potassium channel
MRRRVFEILTNPRPNDRVAKIINVALLLLIAGNVVASVLETDAELARRAPEVFRWFETISVAVFTIEYIWRLWSCTASPQFQGPVRGRFLQAMRPMALVDLAAIAPFYLELFVPGVLDLRFLRVLRLMRLFRLFRLGSVSEGFARLIRIIQAKRVELGVSISVVGVAMLLAAGAMYLLEHDEPGSPFTSIPRAMWWSIVTITTVGYGDMTPITPIGKALGGLVAVIGICSLALPVAIISAGYIDELAKSREEAAVAKPTPPPPSASTCPHCGRSLATESTSPSSTV